MFPSKCASGKGLQRFNSFHNVCLCFHLNQPKLTFFDNEDGIITHVGLIADEDKIIHSSGQVRMDRIDHHGIYNDSLQKYTHKLRLVKRVIV